MNDALKTAEEAIAAVREFLLLPTRDTNDIQVLITRVHDVLKSLGPPEIILPVCMTIVLSYASEEHQEAGGDLDSMMAGIRKFAEPFFAKSEEETKTTEETKTP
jgi:hypothetical protein